MAQQLKVYAHIAEDLGLVSKFMSCGCKSVSGDGMPSLGLLGYQAYL